MCERVRISLAGTGWPFLMLALAEFDLEDELTKYL